MKRQVDVVVISDIHLGTVGCHAAEVLSYLESIEPKILILNGDIIDIWQFSKRYWPDSHTAVLKKILEFIQRNVKVYYLTGNHDDTLRKFSDFEISNFRLCDKLVLNLDGKKAWFFHGDVFDISINHARWLARIGSVGYDILILANRFINFLLQKAGKEKFSLSKKIKDSVKKAVQYISSFENVAAELAIHNGYDYVVCGHIHKPQIRNITNENGKVTYMNSGDWVENLSALEYFEGQWMLYYHPSDLRVTREYQQEFLSKKSCHVFTEEVTLVFQRNISGS